MKLQEVIAKKLTRVRLPEWNKDAYLLIEYKDGNALPWAELHDPIGYSGLVYSELSEINPYRVCILLEMGSNWEPFVPSN